MVISERIGENICTYELVGKKDELIKYRSSIKKYFNNDSLFYNFNCNNEQHILMFEHDNEVNAMYLSGELVPLQLGKWANIVKNTRKNVKLNILLDEYISGVYESENPIVVYGEEFRSKRREVNYFIKTSESKINFNGRTYSVNNLLMLPRKYYLLQLFQNEEYEKLIGINISEIFNCFDMKLLSSISINDLKEMYTFKVGEDVVDEAINASIVGSKLMKRLKK